MKTCLRNCKVGDIIVWGANPIHYTVTIPFTGEYVEAIDSNNIRGTFYERYLDFPGCFIKILKKK